MNYKSHDKPIWGIIYPDLLDKDKVVEAYKQGTTQKDAAAIIGCCDRTFRKALRYHEIIPPIMRMPPQLRNFFNRGKRNFNP